MVSDQVVDSPGKLDHIVHPASPFGTELGNRPLVGQRLAVEIVIPGMPEIKVILKKVDVSDDVIEDHHIEPVRIVVVVKGDRRAGIDDRFVWISRV